MHNREEFTKLTCGLGRSILAFSATKHWLTMPRAESEAFLTSWYRALPGEFYRDTMSAHTNISNQQVWPFRICIAW